MKRKERACFGLDVRPLYPAGFRTVVSGLLLFLLTAGGALRVSALTPPTDEETLCRVRGVVLSHQLIEAADMNMERLSAPAVTIRVQAVEPLDTSYQGSFCEDITSHFDQEGRRTGTFRLCDDTDAPDASLITGTIGHSLGGGPYCIEDIETPGMVIAEETPLP